MAAILHFSVRALSQSQGKCLENQTVITAAAAAAATTTTTAATKTS